jgi:acyl-CoA thioester hydrolase
MTAPFQASFQVGWGDMDFNAHMRNTSYLDLSADTRMLYFAANGFAAGEFDRLRIGPVITRDELDYVRELRLLETVTVSLVSVGLSGDGSRFSLRNEFFRDGGKLAARVTSSGGWLDLSARRWTEPPAALRELLEALPRTDDFRELESSLRDPR